MRKVKGQGWIVVAASALVVTAFMPTLPIYAATQSEIEGTLNSPRSTTFSNKEQISSLSLTQKEVSDTLDTVKETWEQNTLVQVKAEIERQEALGFKAYVVQ